MAKRANDQTPVVHETALQVAQTVVARALSWCAYEGYDGDSYFDAAGLARYRSGNRRAVTVDFSKVAVGGVLPTEITVQVPHSNGEVDSYSVWERLRTVLLNDHINNDLGNWPTDAYTVAGPAEDAIDGPTYLGNSWGGRTFPALVVNGDEATAEAVRIVTAVLAHAEANRACSVPESMLAAIGLGAFMPAATTDMSVELDGIGTVAFTVENDRTGKPRTDRMAVKIRQALTDKLTADIASGKVNPVAAMLAGGRE